MMQRVFALQVRTRLLKVQGTCTAVGNGKQIPGGAPRRSTAERMRLAGCQQRQVSQHAPSHQVGWRRKKGGLKSLYVTCSRQGRTHSSCPEVWISGAHSWHCRRRCIEPCEERADEASL